MIKVPAQYFYLDHNAQQITMTNECEIKKWLGTDAKGITGYPHITTIECQENNIYTNEGTTQGQYQIFTIKCNQMVVL